MKMILAADGVPVVPYVWFTDKEWFNKRDELLTKIETKLGYPIIIKPANLGSSVGIGSAHNREELVDRIADAQRYSTRIIVEHMLADMQEINCSVLGDCNDYRMSVLEEPIKSADFLTYEEKYGSGAGSKGGSKGVGMQRSQKRIPAELPADVTERIQFLAGETFRILSCHGVSRVDVMIDKKEGQIYVNEINTIPGSLSFYLWEATGLSFEKLMDTLVELAVKRKRELEQKTVSYDQNIFAMGGGVKGGIKK